MNTVKGVLFVLLGVTALGLIPRSWRLSGSPSRPAPWWPYSERSWRHWPDSQPLLCLTVGLALSTAGLSFFTSHPERHELLFVPLASVFFIGLALHVCVLNTGRPRWLTPSFHRDQRARSMTDAPDTSPAAGAPEPPPVAASPSAMRQVVLFAIGLVAGVALLLGGDPLFGAWVLAGAALMLVGFVVRASARRTSRRTE